MKRFLKRKSTAPDLAAAIAQAATPAPAIPFLQRIEPVLDGLKQSADRLNERIQIVTGGAVRLHVFRSDDRIEAQMLRDSATKTQAFPMTLSIICTPQGEIELVERGPAKNAFGERDALPLRLVPEANLKQATDTASAIFISYLLPDEQAALRQRFYWPQTLPALQPVI